MTVFVESEINTMTKHDASYLIHCPACATANRVPAATEGVAGRCGSCGATLPPLYTRPLPLTDRDFDAFVRGYPGPLLAEFWAPW
jgi:thioredoxin 2